MLLRKLKGDQRYGGGRSAATHNSKAPQTADQRDIPSINISSVGQQVKESTEEGTVILLVGRLNCCQTLANGSLVRVVKIPGGIINEDR